MQFGLQLNSQHPATENMRDRLQELLEQVRLAQAVGFHSIVAPQHYLPAPFQMLQPLPLLARIAAEAQQMRHDSAHHVCSPCSGNLSHKTTAIGTNLHAQARTRIHPRSTSPELRDQRFIIGSADDCVEQLRLYHQRLGANHFLLRVQWAGMPQKQVLEAITLVGERIIPHLRDV